MSESRTETNAGDDFSETPAERPSISQLQVDPPTEVFQSYPDGGLEAWLQIFYCFCLFFTTLGGVYCWGVFQDALYSTHLASTSTLSYIGSIQASLEALFAIPISRIVAAFGVRRVAIVGAILSGLGPILAGFFTTSVAGMILTEGFLFGCGQSLCFFCSATLPADYFFRKRGLATGIVFAGSGVGGAAFALIADALIKSVGLPWSFRTIGIIFLVINLFCATQLKSRRPLAPLWPKRSEGSPKSKIVDVTLFKDPRFTLFFFAGAIVLFPLFVPPFYLPLFCTSVGLSSNQASLVVAGFNLASACGRIGFGLGADTYLGRLNAMLLCLVVNALSTLIIWPLSASLGPLVVFAVINGCCAGGFFSLTQGVISAMVPDEQRSVAFSMIVSSWAPGYFLGSPVAGYLLQAFGGPDAGYEAYRPAIFYAGGLSTLSALLVLGVRIKTPGGWRTKV